MKFHSPSVRGGTPRLDAPETVVRAVADYAGRGHRAAGGLLDEYIRGQQPIVARSVVVFPMPFKPRRQTMEAAGTSKLRR